MKLYFTSMTEKRYPIKRQSSLWKLWTEGLFKKNYNFKYRWLEIQNSQESFWLLSHSIFMWRWIEFILINVPLWSPPPLFFPPFMNIQTNTYIVLVLFPFFILSIFFWRQCFVVKEHWFQNSKTCFHSVLWPEMIWANHFVFPLNSSSTQSTRWI